MTDTAWPSARPARVPSWTTEQFEDGVVLHDAGSGRILELDGAGALVLGLCDGTRSGAEIISMLAAAYPETANDALAADVVQTFDRLLAAGVIQKP